MISPTAEEVDPADELQRYQSLHDIVAEQLTKSKDVERQALQNMPKESIPPMYQEAVNDMSSPLLGKDQAIGAKNYGFSFNSKKMAQGPHFFNLRIMCHCLGKALKRHIEFSMGEFWFLDELNSYKEQLDASVDRLDFSYNFKSDLKIPTDPKKLQERESMKQQQEQHEK